MMKKEIKYTMFFVMLLITIYSAFAAITFNDPSTTGDTINDTYTLNISTALVGALNCTFATTADGIFATTYNTSASQTEFTNASDTTALTEVEDTTLTVNCTNASTSEQGTLTINIDNTAPVCSYTYDSGITVLTYNDLLGLDIIQSSTDTTDITYSWVLYDPEGNSQVTSSAADPTDFEDPATWDDFGDFILALTLTDEAGKATNCDNVTFTVTSKDKDAQVFVQTVTQSQNKSRNIVIIAFVVIVFLLAIAGFYMIGMSKKAR